MWRTLMIFCILTTTLGQFSDEHTDINALDKPLIISTDKIKTVREGDNVTLVCEVINLFRHSTVSWLLLTEVQVLTVGPFVFSTDPRISVEVQADLPKKKGLWTLRIESVDHDDEGVYQCQVNTDPSTVQDIAVFVNNCSHKQTDDKPAISISSITNISEDDTGMDDDLTASDRINRHSTNNGLGLLNDTNKLTVDSHDDIDHSIPVTVQNDKQNLEGSRVDPLAELENLATKIPDMFDQDEIDDVNYEGQDHSLEKENEGFESNESMGSANETVSDSNQVNDHSEGSSSEAEEVTVEAEPSPSRPPSFNYEEQSVNNTLLLVSRRRPVEKEDGVLGFGSLTVPIVSLLLVTLIIVTLGLVRTFTGRGADDAQKDDAASVYSTCSQKSGRRCRKNRTTRNNQYLQPSTTDRTYEMPRPRPALAQLRVPEASPSRQQHLQTHQELHCDADSEESPVLTRKAVTWRHPTHLEIFTDTSVSSRSSSSGLYEAPASAWDSANRMDSRQNPLSTFAVRRQEQTQSQRYLPDNPFEEI